jgi:hypothetical protein
MGLLDDTLLQPFGGKMRIPYSDNETVAYTAIDDSAFIKKLTYNYPTNILVVEFNSKSIWAYAEISKESFETMIKEESIGSYFNKNIRNKKRSVQIVKVTDQGLVQVSSSEVLLPVRKLNIK